MANQQQLDILLSGVQNWNVWRETHSDEVPDFSVANLEKLDLAGVNLRRTYCEHPYGEFEIEADLTKTRFAGANLAGADLTGANLTGADLTGANLAGADLTNVELKESVLSGANLTGANLNCAKIGSANFSNTQLTDTYLGWVDLRGVNLTGAKFTRACLFRADLTNIDLSNTDLDGTDLSESKLIGANLSNTWLSNTNMRAVNLTGANLNGAKLIRANLREANLTRADFASASLSNAFLSNTNLTNANLCDTDLVGTNFIGACLEGTNLAGAHMKSTIFGNIDLRNVKGLETVNHHGPSVIGTDTLSRSGGDIPEVFLRKAGVSDALINFTVYPTDKQNKYYTCVISYSNQDQEFAEHLYHSLQQIGVRCWYAPEGMTTGPFRSRVGQSFHIYDKLIQVLSQHSIHIQWAKSVVDETLVEEVNKNSRILFPIRLDNSIMDEATKWSHLNYLPLITQSRDIADFTEWKLPYSFQEAVNQLVLDLQSSTPLPLKGV